MQRDPAGTSITEIPNITKKDIYDVIKAHDGKVKEKSLLAWVIDKAFVDEGIDCAKQFYEGIVGEDTAKLTFPQIISVVAIWGLFFVKGKSNFKGRMHSLIGKLRTASAGKQLVNHVKEVAELVSEILTSKQWKSFGYKPINASELVATITLLSICLDDIKEVKNNLFHQTLEIIHIQLKVDYADYSNKLKVLIEAAARTKPKNREKIFYVWHTVFKSIIEACNKMDMGTWIYELLKEEKDFSELLKIYIDNNTSPSLREFILALIMAGGEYTSDCTQKLLPRDAVPRLPAIYRLNVFSETLDRSSYMAFPGNYLYILKYINPVLRGVNEDRLIIVKLVENIKHFWRNNSEFIYLSLANFILRKGCKYLSTDIKTRLNQFIILNDIFETMKEQGLAIPDGVGLSIWQLFFRYFLAKIDSEPGYNIKEVINIFEIIDNYDSSLLKVKDIQGGLTFFLLNNINERNQIFRFLKILEAIEIINVPKALIGLLEFFNNNGICEKGVETIIKFCEFFRKINNIGALIKFLPLANNYNGSEIKNIIKIFELIHDYYPDHLNIVWYELRAFLQENLEKQHKIVFLLKLLKRIAWIKDKQFMTALLKFFSKHTINKSYVNYVTRFDKFIASHSNLAVLSSPGWEALLETFIKNRSLALLEFLISLPKPCIVVAEKQLNNLKTDFHLICYLKKNIEIISDGDDKYYENQIENLMAKFNFIRTMPRAGLDFATNEPSFFKRLPPETVNHIQHFYTESEYEKLRKSTIKADSSVISIVKS